MNWLVNNDKTLDKAIPWKCWATGWARCPDELFGVSGNDVNLLEIDSGLGNKAQALSATFVFK